MVLSNKKIAIVGGGPGGLTLARLLQLKGVEIKVYDRDLNKEARVQGATLDLHKKSGLLALKKADLLNEFKANYLPKAGIFRALDKNGNICVDTHHDNNQKFSNKKFKPEIDRGPLRNILLSSLKPDTVVWDSNFVSMTKVENVWHLNFKNGTMATADIVIGADGANSKIRPYLTSIKPIYTGITMLEGTVYDYMNTAPLFGNIIKEGKVFAYGDRKMMLIGAKGDGSLQFYTSCYTDENWTDISGINFKNKVEVIEWFKKEFSEWGDSWLELFENAEPFFLPRPQYCYPFNQSWEAQSDITILGDAAHLMPPFAGEGVNMAMLDALELSEALTNNTFTNTKDAIASFEKQMNVRFSKVGELTMFNTKWMHQPNALSIIKSMFSKNFVKAIPFIFKLVLNVYIQPYIQRTLNIDSNKKTLIQN
jgi:2-polyprenyl-6-methoxyphenol hydroxylase-like FAD-dependent oxidoreductase